MNEKSEGGGNRLKIWSNEKSKKRLKIGCTMSKNSGSKNKGKVGKKRSKKLIKNKSEKWMKRDRKIGRKCCYKNFLKIFKSKVEKSVENG